MTFRSVPAVSVLTWAFRFWLTYMGAISGWMFLAALGRAVQMRLLGPVSSFVYIGLEGVVELVRVVTVLVIIGHGNPRRGAQNGAEFFRLRRETWREMGRTVRATFRHQWPVLLSNLLLFSLIASGFNQLSGLIADHRVVQTFLKENGLMHESATGMPLFFLLKNLTVIPFTLVFEYGLFRWLAGCLPAVEPSVGAGT